MIKLARDKPTLAFVAPDPSALPTLLGPLLTELADEGWPLIAVGPQPAPEIELLAAGWGLSWHGVDMDTGGFDPSGKVRLVSAVSRVLKNAKAHVVVGVGMQGAVLGGLAGRLAAVDQVVALIDHVGPELDASDGFRSRLQRATTRRLFSMALARAQIAIFLRAGDAERLSEAGLIPRGVEVSVVRGRSVDIERIAPATLPPITRGLRFAMAAPLQRTSGVHEFCAAATAHVEAGTRASFDVFAVPGTGRDAIEPATLPGLGEAVTLTIETGDITAGLAGAHVVVVPAHVGASSVALAPAALALGRPLLVSDAPACEPLVDEPVNGLRFAAGDADALARTISRMLKRPDLIPAMARASRLKAERLFGSETATADLRYAMGLPARPAWIEKRQLERGAA